LRAPRWLVVVAVLLMVPLALYGIAIVSTSRSGLARAIVWRDADVLDHTRFPARSIRAAPPPFRFPRAPDGLSFESLAVDGRGRVAFADFLRSTDTTAFLVLHRGRLAYERYWQGYEADSIQTSFSVAKSFLSTLVGTAIADGLIDSVDDPVTRYVPELLQRDRRFADITLRHLLTMSSGLRYDERGLPWSDDAKTYYATDMRTLAIEETEIVEEPGIRWHYNNYNALLLGLVLERATGDTVASYLEDELWRPMGMEWDASWSLDSEAHAFEKMESGINARARDFLKLGALFLEKGRWRDEQLVPRAWVRLVTATEARTDPLRAYGYFWWTDERDGEQYFSARGNLGQLVFVWPERDLVVARFGSDFGYERWPEFMWSFAQRFPPRV
jgi:CubicO group peptidase (beta-lactamase class C family)